MAAPDLSTNLQEEATCAICLDYFTDPVMTDCGHNFCRECIRRCWGQPEGPFACPECRELFPQRNLRPNRPLAKMAEMARRLHPPSPVPQGVCAAHREPLAAFCGDELRLLCAACERSGEHWAHRVRPLQDAAEDLKVWAGPGQSAARQGVAAARVGGRAWRGRILPEVAGSGSSLPWVSGVCKGVQPVPDRRPRGLGHRQPVRGWPRNLDGEGTSFPKRRWEGCPGRGLVGFD